MQSSPVAKYGRMLKAGVPLDAVLQRMAVDGVPAQTIALFAAGDGGGDAAATV